MTDETQDEGTPTLGRRKFIKRTAGTLPLIATIPGAASATARSSSAIGYLTKGDPDANYSPDGYIRCLDKGSVTEWLDGQRAELADDPWGYQIPTSYKYRLEKSDYATEYNADYVCDRGGQFYVKIKVDGVWKWHEVRKPSGTGSLPSKGVVVSATALQSFGGGYFDKVTLKKLA